MWREFRGGPAVKDSALSLMWLTFDPWPRNYCMLQIQLKKKIHTHKTLKCQETKYIFINLHITIDMTLGGNKEKYQLV